MSDAQPAYPNFPESVDAAMAEILEGLIASSKGEPYDEERLAECAEYCVAMQFLGMGISVEAIQRNLDQREHTFRFTYSNDEGLSVTCEWVDGSTEINVELI